MKQKRIRFLLTEVLQMNKTPQTLLQVFKASISKQIKKAIRTSPKTIGQIAAEHGLSPYIVERFSRELFLETGFRRKGGRPPRSKVAA
jgi:hypothetical protein